MSGSARYDGRPACRVYFVAMDDQSLARLRKEFDARILADIKEARKLDYNPTAFMQMFDTYGGIVGAVKRLVQPPASQTHYGFSKLVQEKGRPELTVEYVVAWEERFAALFTEEERATARERLRLHGVDDPRANG